MSQKKLNPCFFIVLFIAIMLSSCTKDSNETETIYSNGAFISCEGGFNSGNASVSFYSYPTDSVYNNIFHDVNDRSVGDVLQSITVHNNDAYLVVNNSNKVEIVNKNTFEEKSVISDVSLPRYLVISGNTGYISCWGDNSVKTVDLNTNAITGSIATGSGPEKMLIQNNKLYVANPGGFGVDSVITVANITTHEVIKNIEVKYAPYDLVADQEGNIWVLCFGKIILDTEDPAYPIIEETGSKLYKIDTQTDEVVLEISLYDTQHPEHLEIDSDGILYFGGGYAFEGICRLTILPESATSMRIIDDHAYGFNIAPNTNTLYITLADPSYNSAGILKRYTSDGTLLGEYECGINPNGVSF